MSDISQTCEETPACIAGVTRNAQWALLRCRFHFLGHCNCLVLRRDKTQPENQTDPLPPYGAGDTTVHLHNLVGVVIRPCLGTGELADFVAGLTLGGEEGSRGRGI